MSQFSSYSLIVGSELLRGSRLVEETPSFIAKLFCLHELKYYKSLY